MVKGKIYELMVYGDALDAFQSMNHVIHKPIHSQCDKEIMDFLDEAKNEYYAIEQEIYNRIDEARKTSDLDQDWVNEQYEELEDKKYEWFIKWFGECK